MGRGRLRTLRERRGRRRSRPDRQILNAWHEFFVTPAPGKIEPESIDHILIEGENEENDKEDESTSQDEENGLDPEEIDRAAILSHVQIFEARLDGLVRQRRGTGEKDGRAENEIYDED